MSAHARKRARAADREADRRSRARVGHIEYDHAVVFAEHEVVADEFPADWLEKSSDGRGPITRVLNEPIDCLTCQVEKDGKSGHGRQSTCP